MFAPPPLQERFPWPPIKAVFAISMPLPSGNAHLGGVVPVDDEGRINLEAAVSDLKRLGLDRVGVQTGIEHPDVLQHQPDVLGGALSCPNSAPPARSRIGRCRSGSSPSPRP
jgi:hypothetical protein